MTAFPLAGDDITAQGTGELANDPLLVDKIRSGLGVTSDTGANEITVDAGVAAIADAGRLWRVELETATSVAFATTSGTNYVYLAFDDGTGAVSVEVVDTQGVVADPALLIAEVDGSTGAVTPRNDTNLGDASGGDVSFDSVSIGLSRSESEPLYNVRHPEYGAVADGVTDDSSAIQSALDAASANSGTVFFPDGDYLVDPSSLNLSRFVVSDGVNIQGQSRSGVKITFADSSDPDFGFRMRGNNRFRDVTIRANKAAQSTDWDVIDANDEPNVVVERVTVENAPGRGVALTNGCTDSTVKSCKVSASDGVGIRAVGDRNDIKDCDVFDQTAGTTTSSILLLSSVGGSVEGCTVRNGDGNGITVNESCESVTLADNTVISVGNHGIVVSVNGSDIAVTGNTTKNCAAIGIDIDTVLSGGGTASTDTVISGNTATGSGQHGINVQNSPDTVIAANATEGNTDAGIRITDTGSTGCSITGNRSRNNDEGLVVEADECSAVGNVLTGNTTTNLNDASPSANLQTAGNVT